MPFTSLRSSFPWLGCHFKDGKLLDIVVVDAFDEEKGKYTCYAKFDTDKKRFQAQHPEVREAVGHVMEEIMKLDKLRKETKQLRPIIWSSSSSLSYPYVKMTQRGKLFTIGPGIEDGDSYYTDFKQTDDYVEKGVVVRVLAKLPKWDIVVGTEYITDFKDKSGHYFAPVIKGGEKAEMAVQASTFRVIPDSPPQYPPFQMELLCYDYVIIAARWIGALSREEYWKIAQTSMTSKPLDSYMSMLENDKLKRVWLDLSKVKAPNPQKAWELERAKLKGVQAGDIFGIFDDDRETATHIALVASIEADGEVLTYSLWDGPNDNPYPEKISVHSTMNFFVRRSENPVLCFSTAKWNAL